MRRHDLECCDREEQCLGVSVTPPAPEPVEGALERYGDLLIKAVLWLGVVLLLMAIADGMLMKWHEAILKGGMR